MNVVIKKFGKSYSCDLSEGVNISTVISGNKIGPNCFFATPVRIQPVKSGDFIGSIKEGSAVNYYDLKITPHGNGTHTECNGHIYPEFRKINSALHEYHFVAALIDVLPTKMENGDRIISLHSITPFANKEDGLNALIIRTLPNPIEKKTQIFSGTNPPYMDEKAMRYIVQQGIQHLFIDLPSVDREEDGGELKAHHIFWENGKKNRENCTITELIYVPNSIASGIYFVNLQLLNLELDASPSQVVLYALKEMNT